MLYGHLTDKNNPMKHPGDSELFLFPTRDGRPTSFVMDPKTPYMECSVGIHNIFKILHIDWRPPSELSGSSRCEQMGRAVYGDDDVLMQGEL